MPEPDWPNLGGMAFQTPQAVDIQGGRVVRLRELSAFKSDLGVAVARSLAVNGAVTLGAASTDALTIKAASAAIPNGLNLTGGRLGVGVADLVAANAAFAVGAGHINLDNGYALAWGGGTARPHIIGDKAAGTVALGAGGAARLTVDANGNVGIGNVPSGTALLELLAGTTARAPLRLPHGVAPTTPGDGDIWTTTAGLYARINGSTVGPYS